MFGLSAESRVVSARIPGSRARAPTGQEQLCPGMVMMAVPDPGSARDTSACPCHFRTQNPLCSPPQLAPAPAFPWLPASVSDGWTAAPSSPPTAPPCRGQGMTQSVRAAPPAPAPHRSPVLPTQPSPSRGPPSTPPGCGLHTWPCWEQLLQLRGPPPPSSGIWREGSLKSCLAFWRPQPVMWLPWTIF